MMRLADEFPQCIDQMDALWHCLEETRDSSLDERIQSFKQRIIEPNISHYSCVFGISDDRLGHYIVNLEPKAARLRASQEETLERFHDILKLFRAAFPKFRTDFVLYLLPSLNLFKGMAVPAHGSISLLLGMDALAELSDNHLRGYVTHELFHAYHFQRAPAVRDAAELALRTMKMPPLWALLWTEGIACHAVRVVHPDIPEEEVLDWRQLLDKAGPLLGDLATEARKVLRSDSPQDIAGFFYFPRQNGSNIPTGCGYYIGLLVAGILAEKYPIDELLSLTDEELIPEIDSALVGVHGGGPSQDARRTK